MKFGCCVSMLSSPSKIGYEHIPLAASLGFDYVELPVSQIMALSDQAFESGPLAAVKKSAIPCLRMNYFLPGTLRLTGPDARHQEALEYAEKALHRAELLGVKVVVLGSAGARNRPLHWPLEQAESQMVDFLTALAPLVERHGIAIAIEHLNKLESNLINSYAAACDLARRVDHPAIGALLDTFHMDMVGEDLSSLKGTGDLLKHVHIARTLGRAFPEDGDETDYPALFAALREIGYKGTISIESNLKEDLEREATSALRYLRSSL